MSTRKKEGIMDVKNKACDILLEYGIENKTSKEGALD